MFDAGEIGPSKFSEGKKDLFESFCLHKYFMFH